ncbi:hypothetical protein HPB50_013090 [Hyalomma asiaticum]|uniref:Uncharacterized protein n=1 Tax=Hyalomma asiaticum TaxID=266040 RepID=A0ACB7SQK8_HYAAI|nr:hypothetical protein HPB50_013090 [Hyalomma asiaticum]
MAPLDAPLREFSSHVRSSLLRTPAPGRQAPLLHSLGSEGQCIFDAHLPPPTVPQLPTTETLTTDATSTDASKDCGGASKQDAAAL